MSLGRNFPKALVASGFANLADGVLWVALPLLAVQLTRSPLLIAGVTVAARLPWLLALVAGAFADRLDRRQTMVRVNLVRTVLLGGLALAVAADLASLAMLYAVAVLLGVAETLFDTSAQSLLPAIVDRDDLTRANSRLFAVELVANTFVGPPLGGLLAAAGLAVALGLPAAAYLVGAGCLVLIGGSFRAAGAGPAGSTRLRDEIAEGARFVWRHPVLRPLAIMLGVENMAFSAAFSVFVLFAVAPGPMGLSKAGYGILTATLGVGSLLGSWLAVPVERRLGRVRTLVVSVVLNAVSLAVPVVTTRPVLIGASIRGQRRRDRALERGHRLPAPADHPRPAARADERRLPAGRLGDHAARGGARRRPGRGAGAAGRVPGRRRCSPSPCWPGSASSPRRPSPPPRRPRHPGVHRVGWPAPWTPPSCGSTPAAGTCST